MIKIFLDDKNAYFEGTFLKKGLNSANFSSMELPISIGDRVSIGTLKEILESAYQPILDSGIRGLYHVSKDALTENNMNSILLNRKLYMLLNLCYELIVEFDFDELEENIANTMIKIKTIKLGMYNFIF